MVNLVHLSGGNGKNFIQDQTSPRSLNSSLTTSKLSLSRLSRHNLSHMLIHHRTKHFIHSMMNSMSPSTAIASGTHLWQLIQEKYDTAQQNQASTITETKIQTIPNGNVNFILRIAATLRDKPKAPKQQPHPRNEDDADNNKKQNWQNPFLPPDPALFITHLSTTHSLLLNKFNIVPHHVLVVTQNFQHQTDPLNTADLAATWQTLHSMPQGGLAYYNSGPISGASQPHKHMQIVPLPLAEGYPPVVPLWTLIEPDDDGTDEVDIHSFPCVAFGSRIPASEVDANNEILLLEKLYSKLLERTKTFMHRKLERTADDNDDDNDEFSYNFLMTKDFMLLVPRRCEYDGPVGCNSVAFAGSFFVRSKEELDYVSTKGPMNVLKTVGWEW